ncbi:DUF4231 domain-containing protein, partial [Salmonella enterica subsp. enterica serovar Agona]|nr:DUF4231 domain-containing protein [Salmonella enterica subsp. enterica serovar Agona]
MSKNLVSLSNEVDEKILKMK